MIEGSGSETSDYWIRIREAQKHTDPVDPDSYPQHWFIVFLVFPTSIGTYHNKNSFSYNLYLKRKMLWDYQNLSYQCSESVWNSAHRLRPFSMELILPMLLIISRIVALKNLSKRLFWGCVSHWVVLPFFTDFYSRSDWDLYLYTKLTLGSTSKYFRSTKCFGSGSGFNQDSGSGSGSRRAKIPSKMDKSSEFSCFEILFVLFWGLNASPVAFSQVCILYRYPTPGLDTDPDRLFNLKCWIWIRNQWQHLDPP